VLLPVTGVRVTRNKRTRLGTVDQAMQKPNGAFSYHALLMHRGHLVDNSLAQLVRTGADELPS